MKRTGCIALTAAAFFLCISVTAAQNAPTKKKLFIGRITAETDVPPAEAAKVKDLVKITVLERFGSSYAIISDEDVKVMFAQAEQLWASGCNEKDCNIEIAKIINSDEIIYGSLRKEDSGYAVTLTNLAYDKRNGTASVKSMVRVSSMKETLESNTREAAIKLITPDYRMVAATARPEPLTGLDAADSERLKSGDALKPMQFSTEETSIAAITDYYRPALQSADEKFTLQRYADARKGYIRIRDSVSSKLTSETQARMTGYFSTLNDRIASCWMMEYAARIREMDAAIRKGTSDEKKLMKFHEQYRSLRDEVSKNASVGKPDASDLISALDTRCDHILLGLIDRHRAGAQEDYYAYRFEDALEKIIHTDGLCRKLLDKSKKDNTWNELNKSYITVLTTARNYLLNGVESKIRRAEYLNVTGKHKDKRGVMSAAREEITGPLIVFASHSLIEKYNAAANTFNKGVEIKDSVPLIVAPKEGKLSMKLLHYRNELPSLYPQQTVNSVGIEEATDPEEESHKAMFLTMSGGALLGVLIAIIML